MPTQLSPNFTLEELTTTNTGLNNTPNADEIERLKLLAAFMEKVRAVLGNKAISVNSAFRSAAVNNAVGGVSNSAHRLGYACDFVCPSFGTPLDVCRALDAAGTAGTIVFDQLIQEGTWTHVSRDQTGNGTGAPRMMRLTLIGPGQYASGIKPTP
ncbi:MAG: D-Ala-D-Ala carboxypeptidase family metallohydrolase [Candidatus Eremiobacteraeota bacterium]|nr:D-Ala-D-Ala carboxypeptidase family metallohydrolase [Candidatus Eremiobacteraeota bacterium]